MRVGYLIHLIILYCSYLVQKAGHYFCRFYYRRWSNVRLPAVDNPLLEIPAVELASKIVKRDLRSEDVVRAYIERLRAVNPFLNAVCFERYEDALAEARAVDAKLDEHGNKDPPDGGWPPLLGVPVTVKEAFAFTGFQNTGGLKSRIGHIAQHDAPAVSNLRKAGAVILATTNISELCMWWESHNPVYGITRNPYNLASIVGGSSGGEGSVIGAGASVMGLGSDIGGSVRMPSFFCGVFGHKASTGVVDSRGQFPDCDSENEWFMISAGPICRYSMDLPLFLSVLIKPSVSAELRLHDYVDLSKLKYFSLEEWSAKAQFVDGVEEELVIAQKKIASRWSESVAVNVQSLSMPEFFFQFPMWAGMISDKDHSSNTFTRLMAGGDSKDLNPFLELARWIFRRSDHTLPAITLGLAEQFVHLQKAQSRRQVVHCRRLRDKISAMLGENGVIFAPVHPKAGYYHHETMLHVGNFSYTGIWNALGFPATAVPLGLSSRGLPLGIQVISNFRNDRYCLAVARQLEVMFGGWVRPPAL